MISSHQVRRLASFFLYFFLSVWLLTAGAVASGTVDPAFNAFVQQSFNGQVHTSATQTDGKIIVGGRFTVVNGIAACNLVRLNPDGSVDATFNPPDFYAHLNNESIFAIALQSDGRILVGGVFEGTSVGSAHSLHRLNSDGSVDATFPPLNFATSPTTYVYSIKVLADDSFYVGGRFSYNGLGSFIRLNANGSTDSSFAPGFSDEVRAMHVQPDGKILIGGSTATGGFLYRYDSNGTVDPGFAAVTPNQEVLVIKQQSDSKILIGGAFATVNTGQYARLARLNTDGTLDVTFNQFNTNTNGNVAEIELRGDGKILVGGGFTVFNGLAKPKVVLLDLSGSVDETFTASLGSIPQVTVLEVLGSGKILAGFGFALPGPSGGLAVLNPDGTTDTSLKFNVGRDSAAYKVVLQPDGRILVGGVFTVANGVTRSNLARFNGDGTLDTTFVPPATLQTVTALALQSDGKILVGGGGCCALQGIVRLNSNGSLDPTFSLGFAGGNLNEIAVMPNGQILIGGLLSFSGTRYLLKLDPNGAVASTFPSSQPNSAVRRILVQPDGKIFLGGSFSNLGAHSRGGIGRLNADESVDQTFVSPSGPNVIVHDFDLQADGKIVVVGQFLSLGGNTAQRNIGRLNTNGTVDAGFAQNTDGFLYAVKVQTDGKIVAGGSMAYVGGSFTPGLVRLNPSGSVDGSFRATTNSHVLDMELQPDGKLIAVGGFTRVTGISRVHIARLLNNRQAMFDYDGDGRSDVSVFRPSESKWYVFKSSDSTVLEQVFGVAGDVIVPADFDGDGKTDIAIFRPSSGDWWYLASTDGTQRSVHWGAPGDIPRPSDFDADGKTDYIVFRPSENNWYRAGSTGAISIVNFGLAGDKPVTGDFDGDGRSDPAIYRPSTGDWWYRSSINGAQLAAHFGIFTDTPTPADFDGDGKTDLAVYRPSTGTWYISNSGNGQVTIVNFGLAEDKPVAADYDGDGKADIAVFRPGTGLWYLLRSTAGFAAMQFGISTDQATPNAFVP